MRRADQHMARPQIAFFAGCAFNTRFNRELRSPVLKRSA